MAKISKRSDYGRTRIVTSFKKDKLLAKPIAFNFGVLFIDDKKIACLRNWLKFAALRKIMNGVILQEGSQK